MCDDISDNVQDADSDEEDSEIKATDNLIINGRCEGDMSVLEVYGEGDARAQLGMKIYCLCLFCDLQTNKI